MHSFGATVGGLGVAARISAEEVEALCRRLNAGPERRPRQGLAIKTVADIDGAHLDLCFIGDRAAVALSVNLHRNAPIKYRSIARHSLMSAYGTWRTSRCYR